MEQKLKSLEELPTYKNVRAELINLNLKKIVDFSVTPNINFTNDIWEFNEFKRFSNENWAYHYDFTQLDTTYKNYAKYMILRELFNRNLRFTTVKKRFYYVRDFIYHLSNHYMYYPNLIDASFLKGFLANAPSERNLADKKQAIKTFLLEIELRVPDVNFSDCYKYLNKHDSRKIKIEREQGKHKFVPLDIHNKIISLAIQDLRNEDLLITQRAAACMIVLLADTGMRIGEFRILEIGRLDGIGVKGEYEVFYYLNFKTYKTVKEKKYKWTRSFITENALLAYRTLTEIYKERRKTQYLFVNDKGIEVSKTLLRMRLVQFFYRHQNQLQLDKIIDYDVSQFSVTRKRNYKSLKFVPDDEMDKDIYYVTFHQYRVVLATILYNKGYHLDFIRQHMNHLTEEMTQHYIRFNEMKKIEINAIETLKKRSTKDGLTLNTNINDISDKYIVEELRTEEYQEVYNQINKFLKKNKLNIFTDIEEIVSKLSRTDTPIADTELGICAKSFNKLCERNQYISSINDAYYLGVQIHSLEELPFSLKRFQEKASIVAYNEKLYEKNQKYRNELERELKGIKKYIERKLNPELMLLKDEIRSGGICDKYPELESIVESIDDIEKEVKKWSAKTL
ncbi:phage integrase family protein [Bacillus cereus]|uniref:Phage integrase family protein n=2 Tax=Bacillus TaxID=1386 RepID=A0AB34DCG4_BACCE|nr:tyrosine-type recombinase/integrase [Bacillus cereus]KAB2500457.1 phage integrase family protein [Bacillus cereus]